MLCEFNIFYSQLYYKRKCLLTNLLLQRLNVKLSQIKLQNLYYSPMAYKMAPARTESSAAELRHRWLKTVGTGRLNNKKSLKLGEFLHHHRRQVVFALTATRIVRPEGRIAQLQVSVEWGKRGLHARVEEKNAELYRSIVLWWIVYFVSKELCVSYFIFILFF